MNREELTTTFMMISKLKKPFGLYGLYKIFSSLKVKVLIASIAVFKLSLRTLKMKIYPRNYPADTRR